MKRHTTNPLTLCILKETEVKWVNADPREIRETADQEVNKENLVPKEIMDLEAPGDPRAKEAATATPLNGKARGLRGNTIVHMISYTTMALHTFQLRIIAPVRHATKSTGILCA